MTPWTSSGTLFHGTTSLCIDQILREGLSKADRRFVHLTTSEDAAIRHARHRSIVPGGTPFVIKVDITQFLQSSPHADFFHPAPELWLTETISPDVILASELDEDIHHANKRPRYEAHGQTNDPTSYRGTGTSGAARQEGVRQQGGLRDTRGTGYPPRGGRTQAGGGGRNNRGARGGGHNTDARHSFAGDPWQATNSAFSHANERVSPVRAVRTNRGPEDRTPSPVIL